MNLNGSRVTALIVGALALLTVQADAVSASAAEDYPSRPIRLVVPYQAGGNPDAMARALAGALERGMGRSYVIDNRAGASGLIGMEVVARANPDGYTMLFVTSSLAVNQALREKTPYDLDRDLAPVSCVAQGTGFLLVVHPAVPAQTLAEFVALARKDQQLAYASSGTANVSHMMGEMFNVRAGTRMLNVPYKGSGPALTAVMAGEVQAYFVTPTLGVPAVRNGKLRVLGFTGATRWSHLPDIPAIAEAVPGFHMDAGWMGWLAPAKTPAAIIRKTQHAIGRALEEPKVRDFVRASGYEPCANSPEAFGRFIRVELQRFSEIARQTHIKVH
jgi:tripartite-type tricarboxylate transporter receptor subunit TctC